MVILFPKSRDTGLLVAHPNNILNINEGSADEFQIPSDSELLSEASLINQAPKYDNFGQNNQVTPVLNKYNILGLASSSYGGYGVGVSVKTVLPTEGGNYFVLYSVAGNSMGGVLYCGVYSPEGLQIGNYRVGSISNTSYRNTSKLLYSENNSFIVFLGDSGQWYKIVVTNETKENVTMIGSLISGTGKTGSALKIHTAVTVENESQSSSPLVSGTVYPNRAGETGRVALLLPIGTLNMTGWENGSVNRSETYEYSLQNVPPTEVVGHNSGIINPVDLYHKEDGTIYGIVQYNKSSGGGNAYYNSFQIFDKNITSDASGNKIKRRLFEHIASDLTAEIIVLREISTNNEVYFLEQGNTQSAIYKVDYATYTKEKVLELPAKTLLKIQQNSDGTLSYYGSTTELSGIFYSTYYSNQLNSPFYFISGVMNSHKDPEPFKVKSIRAIESNTSIYPKFAMASAESVFIGGDAYSTGSFIDKMIYIQGAGPSGSIGFTGSMKVEDDFSPVISKASEEKIVIDLDDPVIADPLKDQDGYTKLDKWLISGVKNGNIDASKLINVYDTTDVTQSAGIGSTEEIRQKEFNKRINKNPLDINLDIDWLALGFDKTKIGPQRVSYFISDTQSQVSSTSRWINKIDNLTEKDPGDNVFLKGENASISYTETSSLTVDKIKKLIKSQAWLGLPKELDELYTENTESTPPLLSNKVVLEAADVAAIQSASTADKAGPYSLRFKYEDEVNGEIKTVSNKVWIFVTNENTTITAERVMYADDYKLGTPVANSKETEQTAYTHAKVVVYDFKTASVLADQGNIQFLNVNQTELENIKKELIPQKLPLEFYYKDSTTKISNKVMVTLVPEIQDVNIMFKDEDDVRINVDFLIVDQVIGSTLNLKTNVQIETIIKNLATLGYDIKKRPLNEENTLVKETDNDIVYVFKGRLMLQSVTKKLNFERGAVSPNSQSLKYKSDEDFIVKVKDNRQFQGDLDDPATGFRGDFQVQASLTQPFTKKNTTTKLLGAELLYNNKEILETGTNIYKSNQEVITKEQKDFEITLDTENGKDDGWLLVVPSGTTEVGTYNAEITWDLIQGP